MTTTTSTSTSATTVLARQPKPKRTRTNTNASKKQPKLRSSQKARIKKRLSASGLDIHNGVLIPAVLSCILSNAEKTALRKQIDDKSLCGLRVKQPYASSFFTGQYGLFLRELSNVTPFHTPVHLSINDIILGYASPGEPKSAEFRNNPLSSICKSLEHKFVAICSGKPCKTYDNNYSRLTNTCCYYKNSQKAASDANDRTLLQEKPCQKAWNNGMLIVDRNCGRPSTGFPYSCIEGIVLFQGNITGTEMRSHPWYIEGFGTSGWVVHKVIKFAKPLKVNGSAQGCVRLTTSWYTGITQNKRPSDEDGNVLQKAIWKRVAPYM